MTLTIWCENVISEREIMEDALEYTSRENPYAPPTTKTMFLPLRTILSCRNAAKSTDLYLLPLSSRSTSSSDCCTEDRMSSPSFSLICSRVKAETFFS